VAKIISLNTSKSTGTTKQPLDSISVEPDHGFKNDAHARDWHRQISLLAMESIEKMTAENPELRPGSFAENITTTGIELKSLPVGTRLVAGEVELEITQIGKKCHTKCDIYKQAGNCIMPSDGVFAKVVTGGILKKGDQISVKEANS
jgi:MOSC domain-containing protein YiiM